MANRHIIESAIGCCSRFAANIFAVLVWSPTECEFEANLAAGQIWRTAPTARNLLRGREVSLTTYWNTDGR